MRRALLSGWTAHLLALALIILSVGIGFCFFDGHRHESEHGVTFDLCLGVALVAVPVARFTEILIAPMLAERPLAIPTTAFHTPDPPPKSRARF